MDAATIFLATDPARFDVIVTDNLFGDILTDLAAAVTGGIGLAASGNINPTARSRRCSSRCTARAPDIAGQGIADPTAAILSVSLLLDHLGRADEAARIEKAVIADIAARAAGERRSRPRSATRSRRPCEELSVGCGRLCAMIDTVVRPATASRGPQAPGLDQR